MQLFRAACLALLVAGTGAGCTENVHADVKCNVHPDDSALHCDIKEDQGKASIEVCWDFNVACTGGTKVSVPHICGNVADGGSTSVVTPKDKLVGMDKCEVTGASLDHMTIDGKEPTSTGSGT
jgi:hypothetical protein